MLETLFPPRGVFVISHGNGAAISQTEFERTAGFPNLEFGNQKKEHSQNQIVRDPSASLRVTRGMGLAHPSVAMPLYFRHLTGSDVGFEWAVATDSAPLLLQRNGVVAGL